MQTTRMGGCRPLGDPAADQVPIAPNTSSTVSAAPAVAVDTSSWAMRKSGRGLQPEVDDRAGPGDSATRLKGPSDPGRAGRRPPARAPRRGGSPQAPRVAQQPHRRDHREDRQPDGPVQPEDEHERGDEEGRGRSRCCPHRVQAHPVARLVPRRSWPPGALRVVGAHAQPGDGDRDGDRRRRGEPTTAMPIAPTTTPQGSSQVRERRSARWPKRLQQRRGEGHRQDQRRRLRVAVPAQVHEERDEGGNGALARVHAGVAEGERRDAAAVDPRGPGGGDRAHDAGLRPRRRSRPTARPGARRAAQGSVAGARRGAASRSAGCPRPGCG